MRSFVAIDLPEEIKEKIKEVQKDFSFEGLKLVDPSILHITLKFLGDVEEWKIERVKNALDKIEFEPFPAGFKGIGTFPSREPRVIWVGVEKGGQELTKLSHDVEDALKNFFAVEKKFRPHVTIARVKSLPGKEKSLLKKKILELADLSFGEMMVDEIKLKKSTLTPKGPIYQDLWVKVKA